MRGQGLAESLSEGGPILGVLSSASFTNGKTAMLPGDTLIGYSDGALECRNSVGDEFGSDGLLAAARNSCGSAASAALFSVLAAVEDFTGSQPRGDDISLIVAYRAAQ
jgi:phosphoserine phosphatase RsbU/P